MEEFNKELPVNDRRTGKSRPILPPYPAHFWLLAVDELAEELNIQVKRLSSKP